VVESARGIIDKGVAATAAAEATKANALGTFAAPDSTAQVEVDPDTFVKFVAARAVGEAAVTNALARSVAPEYMDDDDPGLAAWVGFCGPPV
jgi:hypothetical protein